MGLERCDVPAKAIFSPEVASYDDNDLKILRLIAPNARMSSVEIAKNTGISVSNVNYRIKKMIENGIIADFRVVLDLQKIGYVWWKIEMQLEDLKVKRIAFSCFSKGRYQLMQNNRSAAKKLFFQAIKDGTMRTKIKGLLGLSSVYTRLNFERIIKLSGYESYYS